MDNDQLLAEIRRRIENGEITADSILELAPPPAKKRGRPRNPPVPKKANGRPPKIERRKIVFAVWLLFHDRLPKQKLKELMADCFALRSRSLTSSLRRSTASAGIHAGSSAGTSNVAW